MQIVIDISEDDLDAIKFLKVKGWASRHELLILNGTPLEKHDEEVIKETVESIWGKPPYTELLDKIRADIDEQIKYNTYFNSDMAKGEIIAFEWVKRKIDEYGKEQE